MKKLVITLAIGPEHAALGRVTHATHRAYADRIGAEFLAIHDQRLARTSPHWEKFRLGELLETYDRIVYLDTDTIVRDDCPDLFDLVPPTHVGAFNEAPYTTRSHELMVDICRAYGTTLPAWDGRYWNTGVLVLSRAHRDLFRIPEQEVCSFYEQSYLNMVFALHGTPMHALPSRYNRMTCMDGVGGDERHAAYIIHYAGCPTPSVLPSLAQADLAHWQAHTSTHHYRRHLLLSVNGGLGDQVCAEPAVRYLVEHVYPHDDVHVLTHWPRLFEHLDVPVHRHGEFVPAADTPYRVMPTLPGPETQQWSVVSNLLCHTVDFCSMALLRRTLTGEDRRQRLVVHAEEAARVRALCPYIADAVLVHAGRHWPSKTFPTAWWQAVVDRLAEDVPVVLIGQNDETRGTVPVVSGPGVLDLRDRLSLGELIAAISLSPVLLSNDSAPIHIAGAWDNRIVLIPSCKHPEHVLPWRDGSVWTNATSPHRRLTLDDVNQCPTSEESVLADAAPEDWARYLPPPEFVATECLRVNDPLIR
jgi:hypothetical protein